MLRTPFVLLGMLAAVLVFPHLVRAEAPPVSASCVAGCNSAPLPSGGNGLMKAGAEQTAGALMNSLLNAIAEKQHDQIRTYENGKAERAKKADEDYQQIQSDFMTGVSTGGASPPAAPPSPALAAQHQLAEKQMRMLACALGRVFEIADASGPDVQERVRSMMKDLMAIQDHLRTPPSGKKDDVTPMTSHVDYMGEKNGNGVQFLAKVLVSRHEDTGKVYLDVQYHHRTNEKTEEGQTLVQVDRRGKIRASEGPKNVIACVKGIR